MEAALCHNEKNRSPFGDSPEKEEILKMRLEIALIKEAIKRLRSDVELLRSDVHAQRQNSI